MTAESQPNCSADGNGAAPVDPPFAEGSATPPLFFGPDACHKPNPSYQQTTLLRERGRDRGSRAPCDLFNEIELEALLAKRGQS